MPSAQVVLIFQGTGIYGWSERFWYAPGVGSPTALADVGALITARCAILTNNCYIVRARIASATPRNPIVLIPNGGAGSYGNESPPTAESEVALLLLLQNSAIGYNRPFLRGVPSRIVSGDNYVPDTTFQTNLSTFTQVLFNGNWNVVGSLQTLPGPRYPIVTTTPQDPRGFDLTYTLPAGAPTPTKGAIIRISQATIPGYNGLKRIVAIPDTGSLTVGGASPPVPDSSDAAFFTLQGHFDTPITNAQAIGITRRAPGRPFGLTRGRRPTIYSLRP